jgi:hypothetical protein
MILTMLAAAALQPQNAVEAERAFAAMAQTDGASTAFLHWSTPEAIMFAPALVTAQSLYRGRPNPPPGLMWWPGRSWVSCDGSLAVNTGPWVRGGGRSTGTFTTVWQRQSDGQWRWLLDHGRPTPRAVPATDDPQVTRASCRTRPQSPPHGYLGGMGPMVLEDASPELLVQEDGAMPASRPSAALAFDFGEEIAAGTSEDRTLVWRLFEAEPLPQGSGALAARASGSRVMLVHQWGGSAYRLVLLEASVTRGQ